MGYIEASCESVLRTGTHPDEKEFAEFLSNAKEKSTFSSEVEITENDTLITLSTCSYEYNHARYIVIGKLNRL